MSELEQAYLNDLRQHVRDARTLLSNANKPVRERMVVRAFLRCLGVPFTDDEIQASTEEPVDVRFRTARYQVMEVVGDKKRGAESRQRQKRYDGAESISDVTDPWVSSKAMSFSELSRLVTADLAKKATHYGAGTCASLDALIYVDLRNRHLFPQDPLPDPEAAAELNRQGWRSVSMLSIPYAAVLYAASGAPDFLRDKMGLVTNEWPEPDGWFDAD